MRKFPLISSIFIVFLFCLLGCGQKEMPQGIDFNDTVELKEAQPVSQRAALNVCVGSMITPEEGYEYYKKLLDYIAKRLNMAVNFIDRNTYAEVNLLLKNKNIDAAFVCGGPYVQGHDEFGLELLAAPQVKGMLDKHVEYRKIYLIRNKGKTYGR